eukprot:TRINITY_DN8465_c0_g1_i3.p1 TRINITY_DN8465_c0_g1~~TRINITY_DN8465_c0_g1_i3.p1  ORF type:complete len:464 (-),score=65.28 TRINITY_DN8465_c0_g1_i3:2303-3694(-)
MVNFDDLFGFEPDKISEAVQAINKFYQSKQNDTKNELFADDVQYYSLQATQKKIFLAKYRRPTVMMIPHSFYEVEQLEICLFVGDWDNQHGEMVEQFEGKHGISKVISKRELIGEYPEHEDKVKLSESFDVFLVDARIADQIQPLLGKAFAQRYKTPLTVVISGQDARPIEQYLDHFLNNTWLPLQQGISFQIKVGSTKLTPEQVQENVLSVMKQLDNKLKYPPKFSGIRTLFIVGQGTVALPIYFDVPSDLESDEEPTKDLEKSVQHEKQGGKEKGSPNTKQDNIQLADEIDNEDNDVDVIVEGENAVDDEEDDKEQLSAPAEYQQLKKIKKKTGKKDRKVEQKVQQRQQLLAEVNGKIDEHDEDDEFVDDEKEDPIVQSERITKLKKKMGKKKLKGQLQQKLQMQQVGQDSGMQVVQEDKVAVDNNHPKVIGKKRKKVSKNKEQNGTVSLGDSKIKRKKQK